MSDPETIGQRLRAAREAKELTLEEAERATRIRLKFLDALERGDYSSMTAVQVQGFMRNYTRLLGLDYDLLLTEFESNKSRGRRRVKESPLPQAAPPPTSGSKRGSFVGRLFNRLMTLLLAAALLVVLVVAAVMTIRRLTDNNADKNGPNAQSIQQTPAATPLDEAAASQPSETSTLDSSQTQGLTPQPTLDSGVGPTTFTPPTLTGEGIVLEVQVVHRVWLRVTADDAVQYEGVAEEGSILHYTATNTMGLRTTDASALMVIINNQALGTLGGRGELFDQTFSLSTGMWVPNEDALNGDALNEGSAAMMVTLTEAPTFTLTSTTSPEPATLTYTPTVQPTLTTPPTTGPTATLSDGISNADLGAGGSTATSAPSVAAATRVVSSETPQPLPTATETLPPALTNTLTPSPTNPPPPIPTQTVTPRPTATLTITPSPTVSPTATFTPTLTPFLPPRMTRTPSPAPK